MIQNEFPLETLANRRVKIRVGNVSLVLAESGKDVVEVGRQRIGRGSKWIENRRMYLAALAQARHHFRSLRQSALREAAAAEKLARETRRELKAAEGRAHARKEDRTQLRPAYHVFVQQRLAFGAAA